MTKAELAAEILKALTNSPAEVIGEHWWGELSVVIGIKDGRVTHTRVSATETRQVLDKPEKRS